MYHVPMPEHCHKSHEAHKPVRRMCMKDEEAESPVKLESSSMQASVWFVWFHVHTATFRRSLFQAHYSALSMEPAHTLSLAVAVARCYHGVAAVLTCPSRVLSVS